MKYLLLMMAKHSGKRCTFTSMEIVTEYAMYAGQKQDLIVIIKDIEKHVLINVWRQKK